jgi:hypothetical protein
MDQLHAAAVAIARERRPLTPFDRSLRQKTFRGGRLEDTIRVAPYLDGALRLMKEFVAEVLQHAGSTVCDVSTTPQQYTRY